MNADIERAVRQFVSDNFLYRTAATSLSNDDSFMDSGLIDSTGFLELVAFLESTFQLRVSDEELVPENLDSINRIAAYVGQKLRRMDEPTRPA